MKYHAYNFNFSGKYPFTSILSLGLVIAALVLFFTKGLNYGVDFKGGAEIQINFDSQIDLGDLRGALKNHGYKASQVQSIGDVDKHEYLIKVGNEEKDLNKVSMDITNMLKKEFNGQNPVIEKTDIVGAKAGESLRISGFQAMAWALLMIMIYISLRFDFKYAPGAIVALFHDVLIIIGVFVLTEKEFSLQIVGALLAIIGYSVNDTVVIYDRVREHEERSPGTDLKDLINKALNETLSRTFLTSATTLVVAILMFSMGGGVIHDFFFAITIGIIVGTYSSLFVAAPIVLLIDKFKGAK